MYEEGRNNIRMLSAGSKSTSDYITLLETLLVVIVLLLLGTKPVWASHYQSFSKNFDGVYLTERVDTIAKVIHLEGRNPDRLVELTKSFSPEFDRPAILLARADKFWRQEGVVNTRIRKHENMMEFSKAVHSLDKKAYDDLPGTDKPETYSSLLEDYNSEPNEVKLSKELNPIEEYYLGTAQELVDEVNGVDENAGAIAEINQFIRSIVQEISENDRGEMLRELEVPMPELYEDSSKETGPQAELAPGY